MQRCPRGLLVLGAVAALLAASAPAVVAQAGVQNPAVKGVPQPAAKQFDILTVDKAELKVQFYRSTKGREAPCVLLLHALGDGSNNKEWTNFAKKLQAKGYAVAMFDFRGHGDSTGVQPGAINKPPQPSIRGFWDELANQQGAGGYSPNKPRATEIKYEKFTTNYYSVLANDIAAVKAFLDDQDCNANNLILIGAKDGATLGALWLSSEFTRYRYTPPTPGLKARLADSPEGLAVSAAVWLSISPTLGSNKSYLNLAQMLEIPGKVYKMPMLFVYGQGDDKGKKIAKDCEKFLAPSNKKETTFTGAKEIEGAEKMTGRDLLLESRGTTEKILDYLESLPPRKNMVAAKAAAGETYIWQFVDKQGVLRQVPRRPATTNLLEFNTYSMFLK